LVCKSFFIDTKLTLKLEDGIQYFSAINKGLKIILTRNLKDFKTADIAVMTAEEYLKGII